MAPSNTVEIWMEDDLLRAAPHDETMPGLLNVPRKDARVTGLSMPERFEAEAMPHLNDIFRTASRMLGDRARAEDVVQEVFLQAWKSFARFQSGTNCRAWLYKILFHCVNHHRRKWFRFPLLKDTEEFLEANLTYTEPVPEQL